MPGIRLGIFVVATLALAGCGGNRAGKVVIGAEGVTEQQLLGEIVAKQLEDQGIEVERRFDFGGALSIHDALMTSQISVYPAYLATFFTEVLRRPGISDAALITEQARHAFEMAGAELIPLGFDASPALAVAASVARSHNLSTIGGLAALDVPWRIAVEQRFNYRVAGLPWIQRTYRIRTQPPKVLDRARIREQLSRSQIDLVACSVTDPLLESDQLVVLEDDNGGVMRNPVALAARTDLFAAHPQAKAVLAGLGGKLTVAKVRKMAADVDLRGRQPSAVAIEFLRAAGL